MRLIGLLVGVAALGCALTPKPASGEFAVVAAATPSRCSVYDATYKVDASLRITETPMGAGDGVHSIGPGTLVLRIDERKSHAELIAFDLKEHFAISPQAVLWSATVVTDASMHTRPDGGGAAAAGTLANGMLRWIGPVRGYRTDGALQCDGSLCGRFGAPQPGRTELHSAAPAVQFQPLRFGDAGATFQMPYALVSESQSPKQKTYMAMSGRESRRTCVQSDGRP